MHISLWKIFSNFSGRYSWERLLSHMVILVLIFEDYPYVFHSGCTSLQRNHSEWGFLFLSKFSQHLSLTVLWIITILTGMRWYLIVVFIWISLTASEVEHISIYLLSIYMSPWEKCPLTQISNYPQIEWITMGATNHPSDDCWMVNGLEQNKQNQDGLENLYNLQV